MEYDNHYYSVPYQLVKQALMLHAGVNTVVILNQNKQVAVHPRAYGYGHTTDPNHMAKAHRKHQEWSPQKFTEWASDIGEYTAQVVEYQLTSRAHPEHGYRTCLGLRGLIKKYDHQRLEAARLNAQPADINYQASRVRAAGDANGSACFGKLLVQLQKTEVLIIDDLLEVIEDRHGSGSTFVTSMMSLVTLRSLTLSWIDSSITHTKSP